MRKLVVLLILISFLIPVYTLPEPSEALRFGHNTKLSNADASFLASEENEGMGKSVSCSGDVNGDGYDDVVVSAHGWDGPGAGRGGTFIYFGKPGGWSMDTSPYNADASFIGEVDYDQAGYSMAIVGDVNGDEYDDLLIGAYANDDVASQAGKVYLVFGRPAGWAVNTSLSNANASFLGEKNGDRAGMAVSGAGDVNGDGFNDILIGAQYNDEGGTSAGQTYLIFGKASNWSEDVSLDRSDSSFIGDEGDDLSGYSISEAGDVNGDNYDDFLIGAPNEEDYGWNSERGKAYLFYGRASGWKMDIPIECANASFYGEKHGNNAGTSVSNIGDVNGDGLDDIIIGSPDYLYQSGTYNGIAHIIFGNATSLPTNTSLSKADASFYGNNQDRAGEFVSGAGDVNGDNYDDFLITSRNSDIGGEVFLFLGCATNWSSYVNVDKAAASFTAERSGARLGWALAGEGDVNGDGFDDILIGAEYDSEIGEYAGQAYLVFPENNTNPTSINSISIYRDYAYSNKITEANTTETVYVELKGTDGNSSRRDVVVVNIISNISSPVGIQVRLHETGNNTGIYRGEFSIMYRTNEDHKWIKALGGENIIVSAFHNSSKKAFLNITNENFITPVITTRTIVEREEYVEPFFATWVNLKWDIDTNASWLSWNETAMALNGTPCDPDVGSYWVKVNVTNFYNDSYELNYTLVVVNKPPEITTVDDTVTNEDLLYEIRYESTDDLHGFWSCTTNASWLSFNQTSQNLSGTPDNWDVGPYWVNITVTDIHGGLDFSNFTLTVQNVKPTFLTASKTNAVEDVLYFNDYDTDDDPSVTYSWETLGVDFLSINPITGNLSGTPDNSDVGTWWVRVIATDDHGGRSTTEFSLQVTNTLPEITTLNKSTATEHVYYSNDYNSTDDPTTTWTYSTTADFLSIDTNTGLLYGTPDNGDIGTYTVNITVNDGNGGYDYDEYVLTVYNSEPVITTADRELVYELEDYYVDYNSTDDGAGSVQWNWSTDASWLSFNDGTGELYGTPHNNESGVYWVNISVDDGHGESAFTNFTLTVLHRNPEIVNQDIETTVENELYYIDYNSTFDGIVPVYWQSETDAGWLSFNHSTGELSGTPDINTSGEYWVNVTVYDEYDGISWSNFTLKVLDDVPVILTDNVINATEDELYSVDYDSDDDMVYEVTWYLTTNAGFLSINDTTGELSGLPENSDVGDWWVNVSTENYLGDRDFTNFTLTVINVNDPPTITTTDITTATEDSLYKVVYQVSDIDIVNNFSWTLFTNASWLSFGSNNDTLYGMPLNEHVSGHWWVGLNLSDGYGGYDEHSFELTVINSNDPPVITTNDIISCYEDSNYKVKYEAYDEDPGSTIVWEVYSQSSWIYWNPLNQTLYGIPGNADVGSNPVSIKAHDLNGSFDEHNFSVEVINTNDAPVLTTAVKKTTMEDEPYEINLNAVDVDKGDELTWSYATNANWLKIGDYNLRLYGTPGNSDVGEYDVTLKVTDIAGAYDEKKFTVTVENVNDAPCISGAPDKLDIKVLEPSTLDLSKKIFDVDNKKSDLELEINSKYAEVDGFKVTFTYPITVESEEIELTVNDGTDTSEPHYIDITVKYDHVTLPEITGHSPDGTGVPIDSTIDIDFNKKMDYQSVKDSFFITPHAPGTFNWDSNTLTYLPDTELSYNQTYKVMMDSNVEDMDGFTLGELYKWEFTTEKLDTDGDGLPDDVDPDDDNDGYPDDWENYMGKDPKDPLDMLTDTDGDGMPDGDLSNTKTWMDIDDDNDNLTDVEEKEMLTNPQKKDTDEDGYSDDIDDYPLDSTRWEKKEEPKSETETEPGAESREPEEESNTALLISTVVIIAIIAFILIFLFVLKPMKERAKEEGVVKPETSGPAVTPPKPVPEALDNKGIKPPVPGDKPKV